MNRTYELIWFVICFICLLVWVGTVAFLNATPGSRLVSVVFIILETLLLASSWEKLTCEKSRSN